MPSFPPDTLLLRIWPVVAWVAIECLVAIWAATSRRPWDLRAIAVWIVVALLAPIEAYDAVWLFTATSLVIVGTLQFARCWRSDAADDSTKRESPPRKSQAYRFHLRDVFLLMLLAGLWLTVLIPAARQYQPESWLGFTACCGGIAAIAILSYASVEGRRRWIYRGLLLVAVPAAVAAAFATGAYAETPGLPMLLWAFADLSMILTLLTLVAGALAALIVFVIALARHAGMTSQARRRAAYVSVLSGVVLLAFSPSVYVYWRLLVRAPAVPKFEAAPNHYRRILEIAEGVDRLNPKNLSLADLNGAAPNSDTLELQSLYAELLPLLAAPNAVDYDPKRDAHKQYSEQYGVPIESLRGVARCLAAEAESARTRGEYDAAAEYGVAAVRLGAMLRRGGLLVDCLVGVAIDGIGHDQLIPIRRQLSPAESRRVIASLSRTAAEHEELALIVARDAHFTHEVYGWRERLEEALDSLVSIDPGIRQAVELAVNHSSAVNRLLQVDLAIRAYRAERGRWPSDLSELTPEYLSAIPLDPFSNLPLRYRPREDDFLLYSVGFDGRDDGGAFATMSNYHAARAAAQPGLDLPVNFLPDRSPLE